MTACGSLQHIYENPLPNSNPTLFDSISSWKKHNNQSIKKSTLNNSSSSSSFNEIFGELHFKDSSPSYPSSITFPTSNNTKHYGYSDSFLSINSNNLSLCTEGLGFESFDNVKDSMRDDGGSTTPTTTTANHWKPHYQKKTSCIKNRQPETASDYKRSRIGGVEFPPPIPSIGRTGKPGVCFKSYRSNGRFILKEVKIPTQEFLHASREDGRLKLQLIQSDDETIEEDGDEEDTDIDDRIENEEIDCTRDEN